MAKDMVWSPPSNHSTPEKWSMAADLMLRVLDKTKTRKARIQLLAKELDDAYSQGFSDA